MKSIVRWSLGHRAVVILTVALLLIGGVFGALSLRQQLFPDIDTPFVLVQAGAPGLDAAQVDEQISRPIGKALGAVEGVENVQSQARESSALLFAELDYGADLDAAEQAIKSGVDAVALPPGAPPTQVISGFTNAPVVSLSLNGHAGDLVKDGRALRAKLENIQGVAKVEAAGGAVPGYRISLSPQALQRGITPQALQTALGDAPVSSSSSLASAEGRSSIVVQAGAPDPTSISINGTRLATVATIKRVLLHPQGLSLTNGKESMSLQVYRSAAANEVEVVEAVQEVVADTQERLGKDRVVVLYESASEVKKSIHGLALEGGLGAFFAVLVILLFLRSLPVTLIAAIAIPTSLTISFLIAWAMGLTLNIITLAGLTVAIGRVIDDAIVVLENIYRHHEAGDNRYRAVLHGTCEVVNAISSSTLATAAVFLPLGLVGGLISDIFFSFSVIIAVALLASLIISLTLVPVLASFMLGRGRGKAKRQKPPRRHLQNFAARLVNFGLRFRTTIALIAVLALAASISTVALGILPVQFIGEGDVKRVSGNVVLPPGASASEQRQALRPLTDALEQERAIDNYDISVASNLVQQGSSTTGGASFTIVLEANADTDALVKRIKVLKPEFEGLSVQAISNGPPSGGFDMVLKSDDRSALITAARKSVALLEDNPKIADIEAEINARVPQFALRVHKRYYGSDQARAATALLASLQSTPAARYEVLLPDLTPTTLSRLPLGPLTSSGNASLPGAPSASIPQSGTNLVLGDIGEITRTKTVAGFDRVDDQPAVTVRAKFVGSDTKSVASDVESAIDKSLPNSVEAVYGGESKFIQDMFRDLGLAMLVAIGMVYLILVLFFSSLRQPIAILAPILFSSVGCLLALSIARQSIGLPSMIGQLLLIGIIVANSILLIDAANRLGGGDGALREAIRLRVRPVMMTALATIAALLPLAVGVSGEGGIISQSLGVAVIGGLMSATLFTLCLTPAVASLLSGRKSRPRQNLFADEAEAAPAREKSGEGAERSAPSQSDRSDSGHA